jgi:hypothetical protein
LARAGGGGVDQSAQPWSPHFEGAAQMERGPQ